MASNTTFTTSVLTSAQMNNLPFGIVAGQTLTSSFTTSATHTTFQDDGFSISFNEISGRIYKITALENPYPSGGQQGIGFQIQRNGTTLRQFQYSTTVMDSGTGYPAVLEFIYTATTSGAATYTMRIAAATANTAVSTYGDGSFPRQFVIEDIGKS